MTILALDLGNTTGWAMLSTETGNITSGFIKNKNNQFQGGGMRYLNFTNQLRQWNKIEGGIEFVGFEEVRAHSGTIAAQVYGGYLAVLTEWCENNKIPYMGFPVGAIKKHACGVGSASKESMIKAAQALGFNVYDDNEADAIHILDLCMAKYENTFNDITLEKVKKVVRKTKESNPVLTQ